ncbi:MAG TPA: GNAT family N-acetyltransferase, partial [Acidimicrobiales bacterium]|nr:GNAT family N-acetyltransferase [Acidimicrobiales bacterium]
MVRTGRDALIAAYGDEGIQRWHARTLESSLEALELINEWNGGWAAESAARWAVVDVTKGEVIAQVALRSVDFQEGEAETSYWVMPQYRQTGVATESLRVLARW